VELTKRAFSASRARHSKNIMKGSIDFYIVLRNAHQTYRGRKSTEQRGNSTRITRLQCVEDTHTHTHHALKIGTISRSLIHASLILWVMVQTLQECLAVWLWAFGSALCPRPNITYRQTRYLYEETVCGMQTWFGSPNVSYVKAHVEFAGIIAICNPKHLIANDVTR